MVRTVNTEGIISRVAGNGEFYYAPFLPTPFQYSNYTGDNGPALDASIKPVGLKVHRSGQIYFADYGNQRIGIVNSKVITTFAGNGNRKFFGDGGPASLGSLDSPIQLAFSPTEDILYLSDSENKRIRVVNMTSQIITSLNYPPFNTSVRGLVVDGTGNIIFTLPEENIVSKLDMKTRTITTIAGNGTAGFSGDGGDPTEAQLSSPTSVAINSKGGLFIADSNNHCIRYINMKDNRIFTIAGTGGEAGRSGDGGPAQTALLNSPEDIALDQYDNLYIADTGNHQVHKVLLLPPFQNPQEGQKSYSCGGWRIQ